MKTSVTQKDTHRTFKRITIQGKYILILTLLTIFPILRATEIFANESELRRLSDLLEKLYHQGSLSEASEIAERHLILSKRTLGQNHLVTAESLNYGGAIQMDLGNYEKAESLFLESLKVKEKRLGRDHREVMLVLDNLAGALKSLGRYEECEPILLRAKSIYERKLDENDVDGISCVHHLAILFKTLGRIDEAEPLYRMALELREKTLGENHLDTADSLNSLAHIYSGQSKYIEAEELYLRAYKIYSEISGEKSSDVAGASNGLSSLYRKQSRHHEAEKYARCALEILESSLGPDHPTTGMVLNNLAGIFHDQKRYSDAIPLLQRVLHIRETVFGESHPDTAYSLFSLAAVFQCSGRYDDAEPLVERGIFSSSAHWRRTLSYFSERECLTFQRSQEPMRSPGNQRSSRLAAEAQMLFKGVVIEAMYIRRIAEDRLSQTERGRELLGQREKLRRNFHRSVLAEGFGSKEAITRQQDLELFDKQVAKELGGQATVNNLASILLENVQKSLPEQSRLVETFRYIHDVDPETRESRYVSTLIASTGDPVFINHGDSASIEAAIRTYRSLLGGGKLEASTDTTRGVEAALYTRLLTPVEEHLILGQTVIFSPDAQLHFLPLGMLRGSDGKAFGEKYQVRYVSSGRDLVKEVPSRRAKDLSAFVLGNPAYRDNAPMLALAAADESPKNGDLLASAESRDKTQIELKSNLRSGLGQDSGSVQFRPLPGTAREANQLAGKLESAGYTVRSLSGAKATEAEVMKSLAGHSVVHFATHGFFLNELKIERGNSLDLLSGQNDLSPTGPVQNPMFRSGLALAGAQSTFNLWKNGQVPPPAKDGVLLAAELTGIDLRGTDLVVLSACETAAGESLDGEGVIGLRRALNAAGATNVIMTLWPVDDTATVEVMGVFYDKYLSGMPAAKALAETQRELLPKWAERDGELKALARLAPFICTSLGPVE